MDRIICSRLVPTARWVISTPTGGRVEPEVYCRCETSSTSRSTGANASRGRIGDVVDGDDGRRARERELRQEGSHGVGRRGCRHHGGGPGVAQRSFQTFGMPLEFGGEQRHRDRARLDRREEPGDVVEALGREDRHPVTTRGNLLHASADGLHPAAELSPGQFDRISVSRAGEIQVAVGNGVADVGDVAVDERNQRYARRQHNAAFGIETVLDLQ